MAVKKIHGAKNKKPGQKKKAGAIKKLAKEVEKKMAKKALANRGSNKSVYALSGLKQVDEEYSRGKGLSQFNQKKIELTIDGHKVSIRPWTRDEVLKRQTVKKPLLVVETSGFTPIGLAIGVGMVREYSLARKRDAYFSYDWSGTSRIAARVWIHITGQDKDPILQTYAAGVRSRLKLHHFDDNAYKEAYDQIIAVSGTSDKWWEFDTVQPLVIVPSESTKG